MKAKYLWPALAATFIALSTPRAEAVVRMPSLISHYMVLQRDQIVPIWGWAEPDEQVTVSIAGQAKAARTGADGKWLVHLDKMQAGGPHTMLIKGRNTVTLKDIYIGEVWLASGQSNMVNFLATSLDYDKEKSYTDIAQIRVFTVGQSSARTPQRDCSATWRICTPITAGGFSGIVYYFAKELHQKLGVPVGVVNASLGSTPIEAWTSLDAQKERPELQELLESWRKKAEAYRPNEAKAQYEKGKLAWEEAAAKAKFDKKPAPREPKAPLHPLDQPQHPANMFNGMIAPLVPFEFRGILWYQGEFNTQSEEYAALYRHQLPLLIRDWRKHWGKELPFAWVQLPNFNTASRTPVMPGWPLVRDGQLLALSEPNTGMIVSIDIGEANSVHPRNKRDFAHRLALWARAEVYKEKISWCGPIFAGHEVTGHTVRLSFTHAEDGLAAQGGVLKGFLIAGADKKWQPAVATIEGDRVVVSSPEVPRPVAVRYSWSDNPDGNLRNRAGLPASPFRTDRE